MADQVRYAAKLLAGELPSNIEDVPAPLGLKLSCRARRHDTQVLMPGLEQGPAVV
ncbi:MAG: hypothetical protein R3B67_12555 [Phycisphaerales bacterium]